MAEDDPLAEIIRRKDEGITDPDQILKGLFRKRDSRPESCVHNIIVFKLQGRIQRVEEIEMRLGTEAARNVHCHFSKIEYTEKGERRHHVLEEERYGPEFEMLAEIIAEFHMRPVIICETPLLDADAIKMRNILRIITEK